jgi:hypothetical protein
MTLTGRSLNQHLGKEAGNVVVLNSLFLFAATALQGLTGCANQGAPLLAQGKPVSGYVRLSQEQVGYIGGPLQKEDEVGFHRPTYIEGGRLNVGTGVLDYRGSGYTFGVRGLGAEGISLSKIEANGEVYGLERLQDFPGSYVRAPQISVGGLWLKNANGVIMHLVSKRGANLILASDAVAIKIND